jgi:hypothetical protein
MITTLSNLSRPMKLVAGIALAMVMAIACAGVSAGAAQAAGGPVPNADWKAGFTIHNYSKYDMQYVTFDGKNIDQWVQRPPEEIKHGDDSPNIRWVDDTFNGPTWGTATYDLFPQGKPHTKENKVGQVGFTVRIECAWFGCSDYTRSTSSSVNPEGAVRIVNGDNGGAPRDGYYGDFKVSNAS